MAFHQGCFIWDRITERQIMSLAPPPLTNEELSMKKR